MSRSQLAHDESLDSCEREELEDLFSFTAPAPEFAAATASETLTQQTASTGGELDDLSDFDDQKGFSTVPAAAAWLMSELTGDLLESSQLADSVASLEPIYSWDSIINFRAGDTPVPPVDSELIHADTQVASLDDDTRDILEWLDKTDKPSKSQTKNLGDGEEIYRLLENEIHHIFEFVGNNDITENKTVTASSMALQLSTINALPSIDHNDIDFDGKKNGNPINSDSFLPSCEADVTCSDEYLWSTFAQCIRSIETTITRDIRPLLLHTEQLVDYKLKISVLDRPHLWTKVLCSNKTINEVLQSSLVDSFVAFRKSFDFQALSQEYSKEEDKDPTSSSTCRTLLQYIFEEATVLSKYIILDQGNVKAINDLDSESSNFPTTVTGESICWDLCSLLLFYYQNDNVSNKLPITDPDFFCKNTWNALIGPVIATLLSASIPLAVVSVMTSTIGPVAMPLISLTNEERRMATTRLHRYFYDLVRYHIPTIILHLDQYAEGWYLPQDGEDTGTIPITWFTSLLAGECIDKQAPKTLTLEMLRRYWDASFLGQDNSFKFFLAAALLSFHDDILLKLRGTQLVKELSRIMTFQRTWTSSASFTLENNQTESFMIQWFSEAKLLQESTPRTFRQLLREAENDVVKSAILVRQRKMIDKEENDEADRRKQLEIVRLQKEEEAQVRSHLASFYEKHASDKLSTVDNILKVYNGRIPLLNQRLKEKYGVGFLPVSVPKPAAIAIKTLKQTIQQGLKSIQERDVDKGSVSSIQDGNSCCPDHTATLWTSPSEVLSSLLSDEISNLLSAPPKPDSSCPYFVIDSRPDNVVSHQGRLHKSFALSPEILSNPLRMNDLRCQLEILRGVRHICIMGRGVSVVKKMNGASALREEDHRLHDLDASNCALFFINEGFPYVSIMEGGFCAAYAWLQRTFPSLELTAVIDIKRSSSLDLSNDKTSVTVQKLLDRSMIALTLGEQKIEGSLMKLLNKSGAASKKNSIS